MKKLTIISGLIIGFNSHHYLELSENQFEKFVEDIVQIKLFKKTDANNKNLLQKTISLSSENSNLTIICLILNLNCLTIPNLIMAAFSEMLHSLASTSSMALLQYIFSRIADF